MSSGLSDVKSLPYGVARVRGPGAWDLGDELQHVRRALGGHLAGNTRELVDENFILRDPRGVERRGVLFRITALNVIQERHTR